MLPIMRLNANANKAIVESNKTTATEADLLLHVRQGLGRVRPLHRLLAEAIQQPAAALATTNWPT